MKTAGLGRLPTVLAVVLSGSFAACQALSDPGIEYRECLSPPRPYLEQFGDDYQTLLDRCWKGENALKSEIEVGGGDLVIAHAEPVTWDDKPPMLVRSIRGEFVVTSRVEALEGRTGSHCGLVEGDAAGIVIRSNETLFQATLTVRPSDPTEPACLDNAESPSRAIVEARADDSSGSVATASPPTGFDGEVDIAICRYMDTLVYFYRDSAEPDGDWRPEDWTALALDGGNPINDSVLDVGLTTTVSEAGRDRGIEGHFNWIEFATEGELAGDCVSVLEDLSKPADD